MFRFFRNRKWNIEVKNAKGQWLPLAAIPPTNGDRIDFIDRNAKYHFDYKGIVSHGLLIVIKDGQAEIINIPYHTMRRIKSYLK